MQVVIMFILIFSISILGCQRKEVKETGNDISQVQKTYPRIIGINSCNWTYEKISKDNRLSVGLNSYAFYGEIILSDEYFEQIINDYNWEEYNDITYIDKINNTLYFYEEM